MKKIYLIVTLALITNALNAQKLTNSWLKNIGGSGNEADGFFMDAKALLDIDKDGNTVGLF